MDLVLVHCGFQEEVLSTLLFYYWGTHGHFRGTFYLLTSLKMRPDEATKHVCLLCRTKNSDDVQTRLDSLKSSLNRANGISLNTNKNKRSKMLSYTKPPMIFLCLSMWQRY